MAMFLFRGLGLLLLTFGPAAAQTTGPADHATANLIVGALGTQPAQAALDLHLAPGWHTYWRQPGDAGVPPSFSFEGSRNLAASEVLYPAPTRMVEDGATIFGYRDDVVFPLRLQPQDPTRPIDLELKLAYAVCERVCIPARAEVHASLAAGTPSPAAKAALAAALRDVPVALSNAEADKLATIAPAAGPVPTWTLTWQPGSPPPADLFAEAPDGWYVATRAGAAPGTFILTASEHPPNAGSVEVRLTAKSAGHAVEWMRRLDISPGGG